MIRKSLVVITTTLLLSVCFTGQLTQGQVSIKGKIPINVPVDNIPINIQVVVDTSTGVPNQIEDNLMKGYILKALREIPDVKIAVNDAMYQIRFMLLKSSGVYTMIYVITLPLKTPDVSFLVSPENQKMVKDILEALTKEACNIETYGILQATRNNLEEKAKSFVVTLDAKTFQPLRELRQQFLQHINPKGN